MSVILHNFALSAPLFILVFVGYCAMKLLQWPKSMSESISRFVFSLVLPMMLFHMMSDFSKLPPVDARLLIAFFSGCFVVFVIGRLIGAKVFHFDGAQQSVFALGGVFSNNVFLGLPLTKLLLGDAGLPSAALIVLFNALILWALVTISVEWALHGQFSAKGLVKMFKSVLTNPIVVAILSGATWGLCGWKLPSIISVTLGLLSAAAAPLALIALGMGLAEFGIGKDWRVPATVAVLKLVVHPLAVWGFALLLGLPTIETQVIVLMASVATGANVYLMSRQFGTMEGPIAASLVVTTVLAALTSPLLVALTNR